MNSATHPIYKQNIAKFVRENKQLLVALGAIGLLLFMRGLTKNLNDQSLRVTTSYAQDR